MNTNEEVAGIEHDLELILEERYERRERLPDEYRAQYQDRERNQ